MLLNKYEAICVIKSMWMRQAWHVSHMAVMGIAYSFWLENMKENDSLDHLPRKCSLENSTDMDLKEISVN